MNVSHNVVSTSAKLFGNGGASIGRTERNGFVKLHGLQGLVGFLNVVQKSGPGSNSFRVSGQSAITI